MLSGSFKFHTLRYRAVRPVHQPSRFEKLWDFEAKLSVFRVFVCFPFFFTRRFFPSPTFSTSPPTGSWRFCRQKKLRLILSTSQWPIDSLPTALEIASLDLRHETMEDMEVIDVRAGFYFTLDIRLGYCIIPIYWWWP